MNIQEFKTHWLKEVKSLKDYDGWKVEDVLEFAESYASQQMPSEEEITKEAVRINDGNLDRYKKGMHYNSDWKTGAMWLKSLQQENQTED